MNASKATAPAPVEESAPVESVEVTAPEESAPEESAPVEALADDVAARVAMLDRAVELFVSKLDTNETTYSKSDILWHAEVAGVKSTAIRAGIVERIEAENLSGSAPSLSAMSYIRTAWDVVLTAGINPTGRADLVAWAVRAKNGRFSPEEIEAKSAATLALVDVDENARAVALAVALNMPSTKADRADKLKKEKAAEKLAAEEAARLLSGDPEPLVEGLAEFIAGAVAHVPTLDAEKLAALVEACDMLSTAIRAELSTRAATHVVTADTE